MQPNLRQRHFLKLLDFTKEEILYLVGLAEDLKRAKRAGIEERRLTGKNIALIFEKSSTRTRCASEVAAVDQGAVTSYLGSDGTQIGHKESMKDTARVLGDMYDAILYRGFSQDVLENELAAYAGVPVYNGLTDEFHPTQMLADLLTMKENSDKPVSALSYAYLGDARNNMGNSHLVMAAKLGVDFRVGAPKHLWPEEALIKQCQELAKVSGATLTFTDNAEEAVKGVDFIHTDVWVSMGEPEDAWRDRIAQLKAFQVNAALMRATGNKNTKFMHCLPAFHNRETTVGEWIYQTFGLDGVEVTEEVFESAQGVQFQQAGNRMHTIKAVMVATLG
ncbi:ornithine carbamoyltransferase [Ignatzschineria rhizosphaerae]|uniref:Ornithine carbamoyltransferase n=1 Tax=Ignatzschineria rhizosphaerae TaxID=2923279 RepID=A0ABY3X201_9GAMM|nr:ornithine carbamoyltransferase [Ignatzschineria rhizosphaerae]UNM95492.1 ornithine carbamoyltransferase [Ignatzschineria rhizosphaerae]